MRPRISTAVHRDRGREASTLEESLAARGGRHRREGATGRTLAFVARLCLGVALALAACRPAGPVDGSPTEPPQGRATVSITLAWDAPTTDAAGRPLDDLAGYRLYFGPTSPLDPARDTAVEVGLETSHTLRDLQPGTYFFAVSAIDEAGNESELSNEVGAELTAP